MRRSEANRNAAFIRQAGAREEIYRAPCARRFKFSDWILRLAGGIIGHEYDPFDAQPDAD
jgi:hypothetical protein